MSEDNSNETYYFIEQGKEAVRQFDSICLGIGLRSVCVLGIVGNLLTMTAFARRRRRRNGLSGIGGFGGGGGCVGGGGRPAGLESSVSQSLMALAVADLCICMSSLPISERLTDCPSWLLQVSHIVGQAFTNIFMTISVWLTLTITVCRYLAVWRPLQSRNWLSRRKIRITIGLIFVAGVALHAPDFNKYSLSSNSTVTNDSCYSISRQGRLDPGRHWHAYVYYWATILLVNACPLLGIIVCNVKLILAYRSSLRQRSQLNARYATEETSGLRAGGSLGAAQQADNLTPLLLTVTLLFLVLISPGQILNLLFRRYINTTLRSRIHASGGADLSAIRAYFFMSKLTSLTTLSQVTGCAVNFIFYCLVSASFRKSLAAALRSLAPRFCHRLADSGNRNSLRNEPTRGGGNFRSGETAGQRRPGQTVGLDDGRVSKTVSNAGDELNFDCYSGSFVNSRDSVGAIKPEAVESIEMDCAKVHVEDNRNEENLKHHE